MEILNSAFIYLLAAVAAVPVAKRLGLGSVLGYLIAGIIIGPALGFVGSETEQVKHFAEFGVVMMLFLVGLELQPKSLWQMRNQLIGLGGLQVLGTTGFFTIIGLTFDLPWQSALAIGMILSLSSTAIVLQTLNEKGWMKLPPGQSAFSVLLFQDIAVIPMLSLLPLLVIMKPEALSDGHQAHGLENLPGWVQSLVILSVILAIIIVGRYLIRFVFRFIAESRLSEIFTASALLLIIGITLLMEFIGLSPALGTFLAGVVLSDSEYRHELESDIAPFKGLLLGLFFISVGAGINFDLLFANPVLIVGLALLVMGTKFAVLFILGFIFRLNLSGRWLFALGLAQAGEFAFVLFNFAQTSGVLADDQVSILNLVVTVSMMLTPALFIAYEYLIAPRTVGSSDREPDKIEEQGIAVIAGVGRFGQIISRLLIHAGHRVVLLDHNSGMIELLRKFGVKTFYGDAMRPDLLESAGIKEAKLFVAALDNRERQTELVSYVARNYPDCLIVARAVNRLHIYELQDAGAHHVERELFESSLMAAKKALQFLGAHPFKVERMTQSFRKHDYEMIESVKKHWNQDKINKQYISAVRAKAEELSDILNADRHDRHDRSDRGWNPPYRPEIKLTTESTNKDD
jgi:monovalent cation:H+ antiporter-2, CPA2 family